MYHIFFKFLNFNNYSEIIKRVLSLFYQNELRQLQSEDFETTPWTALCIMLLKIRLKIVCTKYLTNLFDWNLYSNIISLLLV